MDSIFLLLSVLCFSLPAFAESHDSGADIYDKSLEDLMNVQVTTASKEKQSVAQADSVVTVITEKEIKESGALTIYDLLKRVPGFFPSQQATWSLVTSRGLPSDGNDHFLLLIDGHPQNSIIGQGYQQQDLIPVLDKVERIEIIRGPGSVLWGSSAAMGIISVITKDHVEKAQISAEDETKSGLRGVNYIDNIGDGKILKGMYSLGMWSASGYNFHSPASTTFNFPWGSQRTGTSSGAFAQWPNVNQQRDGFELYTKLKYKEDTEITARILKTSFNYVWDEWGSTGQHELGNRRAYLDIKRYLALQSDFKVEINFYGDYNLQNRDPLQINNPQYGLKDQDQTNEEFALGGEAIATTHPIQDNTLKFGAKFVRTTIGPDRDARVDTPINLPRDNSSSLTPTAVGPGASGFLPYFGTQSGIDHSAAVYFQDSHKFGNTTAFGGLRYDWNDFRENGAKLLPRAGLVHNFSDVWVGKYTYNTGYLRPSVVYSKALGYIDDAVRGSAQILSVGSSERVQSHDLQVSRTTANSYAAATLFYMRVDRFISFDANNNPQGYKNIGDAQTQGVELEAKHMLNASWTLNGNTSYAKGHIPSVGAQGALSDTNGNTLNYPRFIANLGATFHFLQNHSINGNVRYWTDMIYREGANEGSYSMPTTYRSKYNEYYVDLNYTIKNFFAKDLDFNAFGTNLLNNQDAIGTVCNNGTYFPPGRTVGARLAYSF